MNFGDMLSSWEEARRDAHHEPDDNTMEELLDQYPPDGNGALERDGAEQKGSNGSDGSATVFRKMPHRATLDLHGSTVTEAMARIDAFLSDAHTHGIRKVLIIHGKGIHNRSGEPVLAPAVRAYLQRHRLAGRIENPPRQYGGRGALWVLVR